MKLLCFDTCIEEISLTLLKENSFFFEKKWERSLKGGPSAFLVPEIQAICRQACLSLDTLDGIGVIRGPGSFTGIRLGLSIALGLQAACHKPLASMTLLDLWKAYARHKFPEKSLWVIVNTYGALWVVQPYDQKGAPEGPPFLETPTHLRQMLDQIRNETAPPLLVGWDIGKELPTEMAQGWVLDLAYAHINNASLLAHHIMNNPSMLSHTHPQPFYLKPPSFSE